MRVAVVGHTGNVGSALVARFASDPGVAITGIARRLPDPTPPFAAVVSRAVDAADPSAMPALIESFAEQDAVVHLAWALQPNHRRSRLARANLGALATVLSAAARARVPHVLVVSSVGAYSPGPKRSPVDESWPTGGVHTSHYAMQKARTERMLDRFAAAHPETVVTRIRPGLVMNGGAATEIAGLFLGPWIPTALLRGPIPVLPLPRRFIAQVVHADDLADAIARAVADRAAGAFNIAADPVVDPAFVAELLGSRWVPTPLGAVRAAAALSWHLRVQRSDPGWVDLAATVPVMSTERARIQLDWRPAIDAGTALREVIDGMAARRTIDGSPQLRSGGTRLGASTTAPVSTVTTDPSASSASTDQTHGGTP